jgi:probable selenium-dependent hydroxylase accessory protein YqeC
MLFTSLVPIKKGTVVAVIGGGGKTGLIELLGEELFDSSFSVLTTVTTRLARDQLPNLEWVTAETMKAALEAVRRASLGAKILLTGPQGQDDLKLNKCTSLPTKWLPWLRSQADPELIWLIEADGSAGRPVKAHRITEPVLPAPPYFLILVLGLSALTEPWTKSIHRPEIFNLYQSLPITVRPLKVEEIIAFMGEAYQIIKPDLIFLNQADILPTNLQSKVTKLAQGLIAVGFRVIAGSLYQREFWVYSRDV